MIATGKEYKVLATNSIDGRTLASMAESQAFVFIRSEIHLYRIDRK